MKNKTLRYVCMVLVMVIYGFLAAGSFNYQEKARKAFDKGNYQKAVDNWVKGYFYDSTLQDIIDEWDYSVALEKVGRTDDSYKMKLKMWKQYSEAKNKEIWNDYKNRYPANFRELCDLAEKEIALQKEREKKEQLEKQKAWLKENKFFEITKLEPAIYVMTEMEGKDTMSSLGFQPEYRIKKDGEMVEIAKNVTTSYSWSRKSDTHISFNRFDAWSNYLIMGDMYLMEDSSVRVYVADDYIGTLYMKYKWAE